LEKILVDLYCDDKLFISFQGDELSNIWKNVFKKYMINISTLFNYSRRRGKQKEIEDFLNSLNINISD
ncbi:MAG: hypothetical protein Q7T72_11405, partial [Bacteroidales bacterium]|nr:hypothetical protein [Bacteroidales bacterium]